MQVKKKIDSVKPDSKKAYNNYEFLNSPEARSIRVLCEFEEPKIRFEREHVENTIVFFGSARILPQHIAQTKLEQVESKLQNQSKVSDELENELRIAQRDLKMSRYYADAESIAQKLSTWANTIEDHKKRFIICSGGGPGIMEAANRGANKAGSRSVGLNISLPYEQGANGYQTAELSFDFHYFFIRKYWFFHLAKSLIIFPGGFGTLDELFEIMTLLQTNKTTRYFPIVLYGTEYWQEVLNFDAMVKWGTISAEDLKLFRVFDTVDETVDYIISELTVHYLR